MFDDYISTMASAYLAIRNMNTLASEINNVIDVYLSHQQGATGLSNIKTDLLATINKNAVNNPPPLSSTAKPLHELQNQEWYAAWAGKVWSVMVKIDPSKSGQSPVKDKFPNANKLRSVLSDLGYSEKGSNLTSSGEDISAEMELLSSALFKKIKELYPNINITVTAGNDKYHANSNASRHAKGDAIDFTVNGISQQGAYKSRKYGDSTPNTYTQNDRVTLDNVVTILQGFTAGGNPQVAYLDEYTLGSAGATGPHFHFSFKKNGGTEGAAEIAEAVQLAQAGVITEYTA
jgi:hypothetical protein